MRQITIGIILLLGGVASAVGQQSDFRWVTRTTDKAAFQRVEAAFKNELTPDPPQLNTVPMTGKFIVRIGVQGKAALVIIGERENKAAPYAMYHAYTFNLLSNAKSQIRSKGVEWLWMFRVEKLAHLSASEEADVVFDFLTCTECEAQRILAAFHYVHKAEKWELRQWGKEDGAGLLIGSDGEFGDDGIYYYDCLHTVADITGNGLDDVAVRCRESVQPDPEKPRKRMTRSDNTFLYTLKNGAITRVAIDKTSEQAPVVRDALCATKPASPLCRAPQSNRNPSAPR
jgi:hypothetical protein